MVQLLKRLSDRAFGRKHREVRRDSPLSKHVAPAGLLPSSQIIRLGSGYGGWHLPKAHGLTSASVCYLAGAGEDISFDCQLARGFSCDVRIIDPTPRAIEHFKQLSNAVASGLPFCVSSAETEFYDVSQQDLQRITFWEVGLAGKDAEMRFYLPKNPDHVSCSAVNLQGTEDFFIAQCHRVKTLMERHGDTQLDLLKIDIEGAEYQVIEDIVSSLTLPRILLIEFDECHSPLDGRADDRIAQHISMLSGAGMRCVTIEGCNATFVRE
ncbi:Methyltransferase [Neorhizobium galegae bv. officinalis]|nr:Methyltransferase [Neorhizobium galegae bv. officinalis]